MLTHYLISLFAELIAGQARPIGGAGDFGADEYSPGP
jgi:hypothetical protein